MKNIPAAMPIYLLHNTEEPQMVSVLEPASDRLFMLRSCICSGCAPRWLDIAADQQDPFECVKEDYVTMTTAVKLVKFWYSTPKDFDPATILNEELAASTAKQLWIEGWTNTVAYHKTELSKFDATREAKTAESKASHARRINKLKKELEAVIVEMRKKIEKVQSELLAVDGEFAAERQKLVDNISKAETKLAELTSGS